MKHSDTKRVVLTLRDILRDKLRIVNSRKSALCSLSHTALWVESEGERYTGVLHRPTLAFALRV